MGAPVITIFVRHAAECKDHGDEFSRRCNCRKHFRWSHNGKQFRKQAGTRSWEEAEEIKRQLQDQLAGRETRTDAKDLQAAIDVFLDDKRVQSITDGVIAKYTRELERLREYCAGKGVYTVQGLTRDLLTGFAATWPKAYESSQTRSMVRARCRSFLRYCYEAKWLERIPPLPKVQVDELPTLPLSAEEYERLLEAVQIFVDPVRQRRVRALVQLMRWSGLAIRDALTLERSAIRKEAKLYLVVTRRQKTGTDVCVPLPPAVAAEVLAVGKEDDRYLFWDGESDIVKTWTKYFIAPLFEAAKIERGGNMMSHRLRDTFAVDLLQKGIPLEEVSKLLGHESIKTTERHYAKWIQGRQDRLNSLVVGTWATPKTRRRAASAG
jgi:site-specific recombinase XerD